MVVSPETAAAVSTTLALTVPHGSVSAAETVPMMARRAKAVNLDPYRSA